MAHEKFPLKVSLSDGREIVLLASDWIGEGGEGAVFAKGSLAIKLIADAAGLARKAPKLELFAKLRHPGLATPTAMVFSSGALIGYAMPLARGEPFARYLSAPWRKAQGFPPAKLEELLKSMAEAISALHGMGCWAGDLNEFNWQVVKGRAILIDCDSWGCPGHAVSAMMPSIADPLANGDYRQESDWFALAVLIFTAYAGIHPFRGRHAGYGPKDFAQRMKRGASLFDAGCSWPQSVPGVAGLPGGLVEWLRSVLVQGARVGPPLGDWSAKPRAKKSLAKPGTSALPDRFESWAGPGWARLCTGECFEVEEAKSAGSQHRQAWPWRDPANGQAWWIWQDGALLLGRSSDGKTAWSCALPKDSIAHWWAGSIWSIKPSGWTRYAIGRVGSLGVGARATGQGLLAGSVEFFDGCAGVSAIGALALAVPSESGALRLVPAAKPAPGAKLVFASARSGFEFIDWLLPDGSRAGSVCSSGKPLEMIHGELEWAVAIGDRAAVAQFSGEAWLAKDGELVKLDGWVAKEAASCWAGKLWLADGEARYCESISILKILG